MSGFWLQAILTIGIFSLMMVGGLYIYRFLNNKLASSNSWAGIIGYSILLFAAIAGIYAGGFIIMGLIFEYLTL